MAAGTASPTFLKKLSFGYLPYMVVYILLIIVCVYAFDTDTIKLNICKFYLLRLHSIVRNYGLMESVVFLLLVG